MQCRIGVSFKLGQAGLIDLPQPVHFAFGQCEQAAGGLAQQLEVAVDLGIMRLAKRLTKAVRETDCRADFAPRADPSCDSQRLLGTTILRRATFDHKEGVYVSLAC